MKTTNTTKTQVTGNENLKVGMDITESLYSDRNCYYVTRIDNPKKFYAKRYQVCADQDKKGGMGHQNWKFFKTIKEEETYLKKYFPDTQYNCEADEQEYDVEFVYRYKNWYTAYTDQDGNKVYSKTKLTFDCRNYWYDWEF